MSLCVENSPDRWSALLPFPQSDSHKYSRGIALIRGGALMTGAARLAARAAQRMGAGLVTLAAPSAVLPIYAEALESVIVRPCDDLSAWHNLVDDARHPALCIGPGLGISEAHREEVLLAVQAQRPTLIDADALTSFADEPDRLLQSLHGACVLTPHEGEFKRLFGDTDSDKERRARVAAQRAGCILLLKGAETIIASPKGDIVINRHAPPWLATAGSGDVLTGMILGLVAQKMPVFEAAAAAAWIHGESAIRHGIGLIAEDIVSGLPPVLTDLYGRQ